MQQIPLSLSLSVSFSFARQGRSGRMCTLYALVPGCHSKGAQCAHVQCQAKCETFSINSCQQALNFIAATGRQILFSSLRLCYLCRKAYYEYLITSFSRFNAFNVILLTHVPCVIPFCVAKRIKNLLLQCDAWQTDKSTHWQPWSYVQLFVQYA